MESVKTLGIDKGAGWYDLKCAKCSEPRAVFCGDGEMPVDYLCPSCYRTKKQEKENSTDDVVEVDHDDDDRPRKLVIEDGEEEAIEETSEEVLEDEEEDGELKEVGEELEAGETFDERE